MRFIPNIPSHVRGAALNNLGAGVAPTANDDSTLGYGLGSLWVWLSAAPNDASIGYGTWICTDATPGAAVWRRIEANNNLAAAANPIVTDDAASGYAVGSLWIWPGNSIWVCSDPVTGAAVWVEALASAAATQLIETGFDTTAMAAGELGYLTATAPGNIVGKAIATSLAAARAFGAYEGSAGQMTLGGTIELQKIEAAITILAGDRLYLSAVTAGAVTNVPPAIVVSVGYARTNGTGAGGTVPMLLELEDTDVPLNNLTAAAAPTVNDDSAGTASAGVSKYSPGSLWMWSQGVAPSIGEGLWICHTAAVGAAVWRRVEAQNNLAGGAAPVAANDGTQGYSKGSVWTWAGYGSWVCTSAATAAATWVILAPLNNPAGGAMPGTGTDLTLGYSVGSVWIWPTVGIWTCTDASVGAAVWVIANLSVWGSAAVPVSTAFNYNVYPNGSILLISTVPSGAFGGTLPAAQRGLLYTVRDVGNNLSVAPFTVIRAAGEKINGVAANYVYGDDGGELTLVCDGTDWHTLGTIPMDNFVGAAIPSVNEDNLDGYSIGSTWLWPGHGMWVNTSAATAAAVWTPIAPLNNPAGAVPPTVNDDSGDGYSVGSLWIGPVNDVWICTDATAAAAVWASLAEPAANVQAAGYAILPRDIGNVIFASGAGAQAFTLPNLSASIGSVGDVTHPQAGRMAILTIQQENPATLVTITPAAGCQINGAGLTVPYALAVGRHRESLCSRDGLNWFSTDANGMTVWGNAAIPITTNFNFVDYPNGAILIIDTSVVGPISGQLPTPVRGLIWSVKDGGSNLSVAAFTAVRAAAEKIERVAASYIYGVDNGMLTIFCDGTDWRIG